MPMRDEDARQIKRFVDRVLLASKTGERVWFAMAEEFKVGDQPVSLPPVRAKQHSAGTLNEFLVAWKPRAAEGVGTFLSLDTWDHKTGWEDLGRAKNVVVTHWMKVRLPGKDDFDVQMELRRTEAELRAHGLSIQNEQDEYADSDAPLWVPGQLWGPGYPRVGKRRPPKTFKNPHGFKHHPSPKRPTKNALRLRRRKERMQNEQNH